MCGILGQFSLKPQSEGTQSTITALSALMQRRGPDDEGNWSDDRHCTLGFRRLSILDLSPAGRQPMLTADGRHALVMNGEVYNFRELRAELEQEGVRFRSSGDAEVVLYALAEWGAAALGRFNGMFALAFYDVHEKRLLLARDHAGSKPLYYLRSSQGLVFASQYDQVMAHPWAQGLPVDQGALALYLRFGYIPAPYALLERTHMLEAGCWLAVDTCGKTERGRHFEFPLFQQPDLRGQECFEAVDAAVAGAVRRQMVSDVPLGAFLSGGIDSPLVTAIAQSLSPNQIKAFTIGVEDSDLDESKDAALYAEQIGVDHRCQQIRLDRVEALARDAAAACSEPFGDYSIIPTLLVSGYASREVKVVLSGDGGDELFWGYTGRMGNAIRYASSFKLPFFLRKLRWGLLRRPVDWNLSYFPGAGKWYQSSHEHNFEGWLQAIFPSISPLPVDYDHYRFDSSNQDQTAQWVRWNEFTGHMSAGLLKVDRGSMYNSVEVRTPLLDKEVIAAALRVDWGSCIDLETGRGKIPLRQSLHQRVNHNTEQKRGFTVPMGEWLRGPLRPLFEDLLIGRKEILGLPIDSAAMHKTFHDHLTGRQNRDWGLWIFLSLALWEKKYYRRQPF